MSLQFSKLDDIMVEVGIMNQLQHVSIIPFLGATRESSHFNIFMPWMKGMKMATCDGGEERGEQNIRPPLVPILKVLTQHSQFVSFTRRPRVENGVGNFNTE